MMILFTIVHVIVCLFLILVVLLQQGKSADWAGTFGGGSSQAAFGQRGTATLLSKATTVAAIVFMVRLPGLRGEARELIVAQGIGAGEPAEEMTGPGRRSSVARATLTRRVTAPGPPPRSTARRCRTSFVRAVE